MRVPMRIALHRTGTVLLFLAFAAAGSAQEPEPQPAPDPAAALQRGLAWLEKRQEDDGSWRCAVGYKLNDEYKGKEAHPHVAVTALAGLAFLRAGGRDAAVDRAAKFLTDLAAQSPYGYITAHGTRLIEHSYAVRFLAELQTKRPRPEIEDAVWRGAGLIVRSQNSEGGWRYQPTPRDADLVFTAPAVEALIAARAAGVTVAKEVLASACAYATRCANKSHDGSFSYQDLPGHQTRFTFPTTATGVFILLAVGNKDAPASQVTRGLEYLRLHCRDIRWGEYHYLFGHYYAVQALQAAGDAEGISGLSKVRAEILQNQCADGSWNDDVGPTYATAMACLILQMMR